MIKTEFRKVRRLLAFVLVMSLSWPTRATYSGAQGSKELELTAIIDKTQVTGARRSGKAFQASLMLEMTLTFKNLSRDTMVLSRDSTMLVLKERVAKSIEELQQNHFELSVTPFISIAGKK